MTKYRLCCNYYTALLLLFLLMFYNCFGGTVKKSSNASKPTWNWNVEERERAGCTGESSHAWERSSRPRWPTAALLLTYTRSRAAVTVVCVAEQQPPTTGGRPALTHYTLWLGSKSQPCRSAHINTRMQPTNPPTHTHIHWQTEKYSHHSTQTNTHQLDKAAWSVSYFWGQNSLL